MGQTFYFLTATWLAAQGADPRDVWTRDVSPCGCQRSYSDNYVHAVGNWESSSSGSGCGCNQGYAGGSYQDHPGIFGRIQNRLSGLANLLPWRHQNEEAEMYAGDGAIMPSSGSPALAMPARTSEPPLADSGSRSAPHAPVTPTDFRPAPPISHGLLIEPEAN